MEVKHITSHNTGSHKVILMDGKKPVGRFFLSRREKTPSWVPEWVQEKYRWSVFFYLGDFEVDNEYRSNGYGSLMLNYMRQTILNKGDVVFLDCFTKRVPFYERNGFKTIKIERTADFIATMMLII